MHMQSKDTVKMRRPGGRSDIENDNIRRGNVGQWHGSTQNTEQGDEECENWKHNKPKSLKHVLLQGLRAPWNVFFPSGKIRIMLLILALAGGLVALAHCVSYNTSVQLARLTTFTSRRREFCEGRIPNWRPPVEYLVMPHRFQTLAYVLEPDVHVGNLRVKPKNDGLPIGMSVPGVANPHPPGGMVKDQVSPERIAIYRVYSSGETYSQTMTQENIKCYANRHGYTLEDGNQYIDKRKPIAWTKIIAAQHLLPKFAWIFYIDTDAIIVDTSQKLEELLDTRYDLIITADQQGLNSGAFLLRNTEWSRDFLNRLMEQTHLVFADFAPFLYEQRAFHYLLRTDPSIREHIKILPSCAFNSRLETPFWHPDIYVPGDFVLHMAGKRKAEKSSLMLPYLEEALEQCSKAITVSHDTASSV